MWFCLLLTAYCLLITVATDDGEGHVVDEWTSGSEVLDGAQHRKEHAVGSAAFGPPRLDLGASVTGNAGRTPQFFLKAPVSKLFTGTVLRFRDAILIDH